MMQVPNIGPFVRSLLPVRLKGGFTVTFGVWLAVHPDELQRASRMWWAADYSNLAIEGWLANAIPGWGLLAAPAVARVENPDHTPYIRQSSDEGLTRLLAEEWPHDQVLHGLP